MLSLSKSTSCHLRQLDSHHASLTREDNDRTQARWKRSKTPNCTEQNISDRSGRLGRRCLQWGWWPGRSNVVLIVLPFICHYITCLSKSFLLFVPSFGLRGFHFLFCLSLFLCISGWLRSFLVFIHSKTHRIPGNTTFLSWFLWSYKCATIHNSQTTNTQWLF